jgi:hypothetical protein
MLQEVLVGLGLSSFFRPTSSDGLPLSTVVLLVVFAFWAGFSLGAGLILLWVSPSLRRVLRRLLLSVLTDEEGGRDRLSHYRRS